MGRPVKNICGTTFGYWTAVRFSHVKNKKVAFWLCRCKCGTERVVSSRTLQDGTTKSCGCLKIEKMLGTAGRRTTHGYVGTPIYISWKHMRGRCLNKNNAKFKDYGGRGITICKRWDKFEFFLKDMGRSWFEGATIDRKNVNGNYTPKNCVWSTKVDQAKNKRNSIYIKIGGKQVRLKDACTLYGINYGTAVGRFKRGWSGDRIVSKQDWRKL